VTIAEWGVKMATCGLRSTALALGLALLIGSAAALTSADPSATGVTQVVVAITQAG